MVPRLTGKIDKILIEMGLYGSVWVDIEGIRSHVGCRGSDMARRGLGGCIILKYFLDVGWENILGKKSKKMHEPEVGAGGQNS